MTFTSEIAASRWAMGIELPALTDVVAHVG